MSGLKDGPKDLEKTLADRNEYLNIPKVGMDENVAFPAFQLNIAAAVDADDGLFCTSTSLMPDPLTP